MEDGTTNAMSGGTGRGTRSVLLGAAFLMATSAIGPGFLTQTTVFTARLGASFGFAILISILFDLGAQLNIWRVIAVSGRRAQDVANAMLPGLGHALAFLVAAGGLAFNIGNVAGAGLGLNAMLGIDPVTGAVASAAVGIALFLVREAGRAMDRFAQVMGFVMVGLMLTVAIGSHPPVAEAALRSVAPTRVDVLTIVTLVGGTVGGYITFAGAPRCRASPSPRPPLSASPRRCGCCCSSPPSAWWRRDSGSIRRIRRRPCSAWPRARSATACSAW
jgi:Mn2+/Fe2+ NRAMP family transporter